MVRLSLVIVGAALLAGCNADPVQGRYSYGGSMAGKQDFHKPVEGSKEYSQPKDNAVEASSRVEKSVESATNDEFKPLAKVDNDSVKVTNRSDKPLADVKVEINGKYTTKVDSIPAHGSVTIDRDQFKTGDGEAMPRAAHVDRIDVWGSGKHLSEFNPPSENK
jgi:hypothetical protein